MSLSFLLPLSLLLSLLPLNACKPLTSDARPPNSSQHGVAAAVALWLCGFRCTSESTSGPQGGAVQLTSLGGLPTDILSCVFYNNSAGDVLGPGSSTQQQEGPGSGNGTFSGLGVSAGGALSAVAAAVKVECSTLSGNEAALGGAVGGSGISTGTRAGT